MAQLIKGKQIGSQTVTISGSTGNVIISGNVDTNGFPVIVNTAPTSNYQLANKEYVDAVAKGLSPHAPVLVISSSNLGLTGIVSVDGVLLSVDDSVLVNGQTDETENGLWLVKTGAWVRRPDADGAPDNEVQLGDFVFVESGTTNTASGWVLGETDATGDFIDPGTDTQVWFKMAAPGSYSTDGEGIILDGSEFQLKLDGTTLVKSASGLKLNDTISSAITTNTDNISTVSSALSTEISSTNSDVTSLDTAIDLLSSSLSVEISSTNDDVNSLSTNISTNTSSITSLDTALSSEISSTNSDVTSLSTAIDNVSNPEFVENNITPANTGIANNVIVSTTAFTGIVAGETVEEGSVNVFLNGIIYPFEFSIGTPAIFYTAAAPGVGDTTLYFDGSVAGFSIETDDSVKLKYVKTT